MALANHVLPFRPLRGGIGILNPIAAEPGTIACIATSDRTDRWIVSCFHVLARSQPGQGPAFASGEPIMQPTVTRGAVAQTDIARASAALDCAAALVVPGITTVGDLLGIGPPRLETAPVVGMRLIKSGQETGVTEGTVTGFARGVVQIEPPSDFPTGYRLSAPGDSGALWVTKDTKAAVALHRGGSAIGGPEVFAVPFSQVLSALGLFLVGV